MGERTEADACCNYGLPAGFERAASVTGRAIADQRIRTSPVWQSVAVRHSLSPTPEGQSRRPEVRCSNPCHSAN